MIIKKSAKVSYMRRRSWFCVEPLCFVEPQLQSSLGFTIPRDYKRPFFWKACHGTENDPQSWIATTVNCLRQRCSSERNMRSARDLKQLENIPASRKDYESRLHSRKMSGDIWLLASSKQDAVLCELDRNTCYWRGVRRWFAVCNPSSLRDSRGYGRVA